MFFNFAVVRQHFRTRAEDEDVILGNDVLIRCRVPSFVGDFVDVVGWINSDGVNFVPGRQNFGKFGPLSTLVVRIVIIFVAVVFYPFQHSPRRRLSDVISHHCEPHSKVYLPAFHRLMPHFSVVGQTYTTQLLDEYVIIGNDALFKCTIPSYVTDFVSVVSWVDSEGNTILASSSNHGITMAPHFRMLLRRTHIDHGMTDL